MTANFFFHPSVSQALRHQLPVVALESTVITHGLPRPQNIQLAKDMEARVREHGATPATIALLDGQIRVGLDEADLIRLADSPAPLKVSLRDFAAGMVKKQNGGATVAATMYAAHQAGIQTFATGGIGGVHKETAFDISTDLKALAEIPVVVVCAGAKAILDLPATLEYLETMGVPVIGFQTDEFPAFYSRQSGLGVSAKLNSPAEIAAFAKAHWNLGMKSGILVCNPIPLEDEIPAAEMQPFIAQASQEAIQQNIHGQKLTPFLLGRISELTQGRSLQANLSLLLNNAKLAAQIAAAMHNEKQRLA